MKKLLANLAKRITLPGFQGVPLYNFGIVFSKGIKEGALTMRASSLAYNFFLAIFPSIIFFFTIIPFVPIRHFQSTLFDLLKEVMPKTAFAAAEETIVDIVKHQHRKMLSVGFLTALYFSTNGIHAMINAFNNTYHQVETRSFIKQRLVSILLVVIASLVLIATIIIILYTELLLGRLPVKHYSIFWIQLGRFISVLILFLVVISFYYHLGPVNSKGQKFISTGSVLATILSLSASFGFAYYVNHFGKYNKLYGSIGALIVVMLWIYFISMVLLLGFELNASIRSAKLAMSKGEDKAIDE